MITEEKKYLNKCLDQTSSSLRKDIMPFWMEHGLDRKNGGVFTALDRDGTLMDSTKSVWFQGRFGYVAALAYLHDPFHSQWLEASKSCIDFIEEHCFDTDGHMFFEVTAEGKPLRKRRYVFSECFAIMAMAVLGTVYQAQTVWNLGDIGVGLQAWINVIVLILLSREGFRILREFEKKG